MIAIAMIKCDRSSFRPADSCGVNRRNGKEDEADRCQLSDDDLSWYFHKNFLDNAFELSVQLPYNGIEHSV
jgi:hypothetical protein